MNPHKIKFTDGIEFECISLPFSKTRNSKGKIREVLEIKIKDSYENIKNSFIDGAEFSILIFEELLNISGLPTREFDYVKYDKFDYVVAGEIVDNRDGVFTIFMGKKTEIELIEEENAALLFEVLTSEVF